MDITLNGALIINVSIAVTIGVIFAPVISNFASAILKIIARPAIRLFFPLKFKIFFISNQTDIENNIFQTSQIIEWQADARFNHTYTDLNFTVYPEVYFRFLHLEKYKYSFPFSFRKWLYQPDEMEIQFICTTNNFNIIGRDPQPGRPNRYQVAVTPNMQLNIMYHCNIKICPLMFFDNQMVTIRVYYQGLAYDNNIYFSLPSSQTH